MKKGEIDQCAHGQQRAHEQPAPGPVAGRAHSRGRAPTPGRVREHGAKLVFSVPPYEVG